MRRYGGQVQVHLPGRLFGIDMWSKFTQKFITINDSNEINRLIANWWMGILRRLYIDVSDSRAQIFEKKKKWELNQIKCERNSMCTFSI